MFISFSISELAYVLMGVSALFTIIYLLWMNSRRRSIKSCVEECENGSTGDSNGTLPGVSIIVYAHNDADYLQNNLPYLLNQTYPQYEVIVVNDGMSFEDSSIVGDFRKEYPNLYLTFIPEDTRNVSHRKLALMIGIKAAKYDVIVTTNANCHPKSPDWLRSMAVGFTDPATEVVIGQAHTNLLHSESGAGRWYRLFDSVTERIMYLSYAICGKPYRGIGDNLAFRKQTFFHNKGFSHSMNLHHGEDDIFVSEIATGENTQVAIGKDAIMSVEYQNTSRMWQELKYRRDFTSRYIKTTAFTVASLMSVVYYLDFAAIAALAATNCRHVIVLSAALLLLLLLTLPQIFISRSCFKALHEPRLFFAIPLFTLWRPIANLYFRLKGQRYHTQNFTWQRKK